MKLLLANPRGFCAGVDRAIDIVEKALLKYGKPIYVRHEVVHNKRVVQELKKKGAIFVEELDTVPNGSTVIFSAHGVSKKVRNQANKFNLLPIDATCPLVTKVHLETSKLYQKGYKILMIGHKGHPEVEGTMGQVDKNMYLIESVTDVEKLPFPKEEKLAYVTQTTLSIDDTTTIIDALKKKFPNISGPKKKDICYATQNRQDAVKKISPLCDLFLIVGSPNSSNTNRLREVATSLGVTSYRIEHAHELNKKWLKNASTIGLTAGASAPESLVTEVIERLKNLGVQDIENVLGVEENVFFPRPKELRT